MVARAGWTLGLLVAGVVAAALPATGQDGPESLLPPGFGSPSPPSSATPAQPAGPRPQTSTRPSADGFEDPVSASPVPTASPVPALAAAEKKATADEEDEDPEARALRFDVPPGARRSMDAVGVIAATEGGYPDTLFAGSNGRYVLSVAEGIKRSLGSRWGTIMLRRALSSRTITPTGVNGADWVARRSWLLLRLGDAPAARGLLQQVDGGNYSRSLYRVAMPIYLANGDPAGTCPLLGGANAAFDDPQWKTARAMCGAFSGEQGRAMSALNQARRSGWVKGIDYLLTEKVVGAGAQGGRAVKIEWDGVETITTWRHGLALTVGILPPSPLYADAAPHLKGWLATAPMLPAADRLRYAVAGGALGIMSNQAMIDVFARAGAEADENDAAVDSANLLESAYVSDDAGARLSAMRQLWDDKMDVFDGYGMEVLTARAAALLPPGNFGARDIDRIISSLFTAGLDRQARVWAPRADQGSLGWALLAVGDPRAGDAVARSAVKDFMDGDDSDRSKKSQFLVAALAGLGRIDQDDASELAAELEFSFSRVTPWTREIDRAAGSGRRGAVILLAAAGLQAAGWDGIPARHLYRIVRSLKAVGLEPEARMIAAEAIRRS